MFVSYLLHIGVRSSSFLPVLK